MSLRNHLILFVKAPRVGAVKSRLARDIGRHAAWRFYVGSVAATIRAVARDPRWTTRLAVTPDRSARAAGPWSGNLPRVAQGGGDLGRRMDRAMHRLPPGPAVLVGGDIPGIRRAHIAAAFRALGDHDAVFGPARDGGFWLVGLRRRPRQPYPYRKVPWSSETTLAATLANLRGLRVAFVETLDDIDDGADLERVRARRAPGLIRGSGAP